MVLRSSSVRRHTPLDSETSTLADKSLVDCAFESMAEFFFTSRKLVCFE